MILAAAELLYSFFARINLYLIFTTSFLGQTNEFFNLTKYKIEIGKDFKRLKVFYLC